MVVVMVVVDHGDRGRLRKERGRINDVFEGRVHCLAVQPRAPLQRVKVEARCTTRSLCGGAVEQVEGTLPGRGQHSTVLVVLPVFIWVGHA